MTGEENVTTALRSEFLEHLTQASKTPYVTDGNDKRVRDIFDSTPPSECQQQLEDLDWSFTEQLTFSPPVPCEVTKDEII